MYTKLKYSIMALLLLPQVADAAVVLSAQHIKDVIVNLDSGIHFRTTEAMVNPDDCASGSWYKLDSESKYEKEAFSLLLSAQARDKTITVYLNGCTGSYPKVSYVY